MYLGRLAAAPAAGGGAEAAPAEEQTEFSVVLAKGRGNFLCKRRMFQALRDADDLDGAMRAVDRRRLRRPRFEAKPLSVSS